MHWIANAVSIVLSIAIIVAIFIQDHTNSLPLGLFNQNREQYAYLSDACLIVAIGISLILTTELFHHKRRRLGSALRAALGVLIAAELLLRTIDRQFISRNPQSTIGGPYYERQTARGSWVFLKKPHAGAIFGFRTDHPYERHPRYPRILFLGDSYTEGSGHSIECNYPNVAEKVLRDQRWQGEIMNSGVAGYGPLDALNLLQLLKDDGYHFDALVYNLFTENDLTDNLPETQRRVVAGIVHRFPQSWFLRAFHPLNSYLFRYAIVVRQLSTLSSEDENPAILLKSGHCMYSENNSAEDSPFLRELILQRMAGSARGAQSKRAQQEFIRTIAAIKAEADNSGVPFSIAVFPDRVLVDAELRKRLDVNAEQVTLLRSLNALVYRAVPGTMVIEIAEVLQGRPGMYGQGDTHLSDLGNKIAGEYVGEKLHGWLPTLLSERRPAHTP